MAGRPPKSVKVLKLEGKSHRTKRELAQRERMERESLTGRKIREEKQVKEDRIAHEEFLRVIKLIRLLEKDDDLYGAQINLYCKLKSEIAREEEEQVKLLGDMDRLRNQSENFEEPEDILSANKILQSMKAQAAQCDNRIQTKRKMRMDIEKNNMMNIAASLRSIPKTAEKKKSPLAEALGG